MRRRLTGRRVLKVLLILLALALLPRYVLVPSFWVVYAEYTAWRYRANPTAERNVRFMYLTHEGYVSQGHALRLLRAKAEPRLLMRPNYPAGSSPRALIVSDGAARGWKWELEYADGDGFIPGFIPPPTSHGALHRSVPAGNKEVIIRHVMWGRPYYARPEGFPFEVLPRWTFSGEVLMPTQALEYRFPVKAKVVSPSEFQDLEFVKSPALDLAVRQSIAATILPMSPCMRTSYGGRIAAASMEELLLTFHDLPADLVMKVEFSLANESTYVPDMSGTSVDDVYFRDPYGTLTMIALEGTTGKSAMFYGLGDPFTLESLYAANPGTYECTLRLTTDRQSAIIDPRVHRVWDGTLEFPVLLNVDYVDPGPPPPVQRWPDGTPIGLPRLD